MKTALDMLNELDQFFSEMPENEREQADLWLVLAALRGPDQQDPDLKHRTTARIRTAAFPSAARGGAGREASFSQPGAVVEVLSEDRHHVHFINHVCSARDILRRMGRTC